MGDARIFTFVAEMFSMGRNRDTIAKTIILSKILQEVLWIKDLFVTLSLSI
jgi:hypothetical protein